MKNNTLQEFQEFLRSRRLVQEKYITYYDYCASSFLAFTKKDKHLGHELKVIGDFVY